MTESKYEELVSALTDAGVALRDVNGDYRSTYDIMKDIASVWDDMSDMEQAALTTAVAGTRMQNVFASCVGSFKEASGAMEAMNDSAGTLEQSYATYLDSIEGRTAQMEATFQALSQSVLSSDTVKGFTESLTGLLKILDDFVKLGNGIPAKILLITVLLKAIPLSTVINLLKSFTLHTTLATIAEQGFAATLAATNTQSLLGFILLIPKAIVGLIALSKEFSFAEVKALGLKGALDLLNINPVMLALSALVALIAGAAIAISVLNNRTSDLADSLSDSAQQLNNTLSEIDDINDELRTTQSRIRELQQQGTLTVVEQEELERLVKINGELEKQKALKKTLAETDRATTQQDFVDVVNSFENTPTPSFWDFIAQALAGGTSFRTSESLRSDAEKFEDALQDYNDALSSGADKSKLEGYYQTLTGYIKQFTEWESKLADIDYDEMTPDAREALATLQQYEIEYLKLKGNSGDIFNFLLGTTQWSELHDQIAEVIADGKSLEDVYSGLGSELNTNDKWRDFINVLAEATGLDYGQAHMLTLQMITGMQDLGDATEDTATDTDEAAQSLEKLKSEIDSLNDALDDLQSTYDTLSDIRDDYEENGFFTLDNLQDLLELEPEYLNLLIDENGQLNLNTQTYYDYIEAKAKSLVLDQIEALYKSILAMESEEAQAYANATAYDTESDSIITATRALTDYYYAQARIKDMENQTTAYTDALSRATDTAANYCAMYDNVIANLANSQSDLASSTSDATDALEEQRDALQDTLDDIEDAQSAVTSLIDRVIDYIKKQKEIEKDELQDQKDAFDDLIESEKEKLRLKYEEIEAEKTLSDLQNSVAKDALAASIASLDDSAAGKKAYKEANDNLLSSRSDLYDELAEREYNTRVDALDALKDAQDDYYDSEIQIIEDYLDKERQIYEDACYMIDHDTGDLYDKLWEYTYNYTTETRAEFDYMWSEAQSALSEYRDANMDLLTVLETMQTDIYRINREIDILDEAIDNESSYVDNLAGSWANATSNALAYKNAIAQTDGDVGIPSNAKWGFDYYTSDGQKHTVWSTLEDFSDAALDIISYIQKTTGVYRPDVYGGMRHFASGTLSAPGGLSEVNENGHEIRVLNKGDGIITSQITKNLSQLGATLGSNPVQFFADAGKELLSKISNAGVMSGLLGVTPTTAAAGVGSSGDMPITIVNHINGDVNPSTLKALEKAQKQITDNAINGVFKKTLGLRNSSRVR